MSHADLPVRLCLALVGLTASSLAMAQDETPPYSADIEFVRPSFGNQAFSGVDVPWVRKAYAFRYGLVAQYSRNPLTLYDGLAGEELGVVVQNRLNFAFGFSIDVGDRLTLGAVLPLAGNSGSDPVAQAFAANTFGVGDASGSARVILIRTPKNHFALGARGAVFIPTGRKQAYIGEVGVRANAGLQAMVNVGPVMIATDASVMSRGTNETDEDFVLGPELVWNSGVRYKLPDATRTAFTAQVLSRAGFADFLAGKAENAVEVIGGLQLYPSENVTLDFGLGRGLTAGYGSSDMRFTGGVTFQRAPKPEVVPSIVRIPPPPPVPALPPPIPEPEPEVVWEEGELAKVTEDAIVIRDMLEFKVGTTQLLDESRPTLQAIAKVLNENGAIGHLVIEGHASEEGSFDYNYNLSVGRARAIFQELLREGVHSSRMSYRGMGEVVPLKEGSDEDAYQVNRRVEFHIVRQYGELEERPDLPEVMRLPWSGDQVKVIEPPKPEAPPPVDPNGSLFDTSDDEFEIDTSEKSGEGEGATPAPKGKQSEPAAPKGTEKSQGSK